MEQAHIGILGAGAFGTALAIALARGGQRVVLWGRSAAAMQEMAHARENTQRLPGVRLPDGVCVTNSLEQACAAPTLLVSVPTQQVRATLSACAKQVTGRTLVACCKGVELTSGLLPSEVIADCVPSATPAVLTGPSFAADIARGKPTALTLALETGGEDLQQQLATPDLRLYLSHDPTGAQLGGALKNVIAIAAGIAMGAGLGESARAALMTRGFAELTRYAQNRGALPETLLGLSGFGDLVLTCTSAQSRNYSHGLALGAGAPPDPTKTVEGVMTAQALASRAEPDMMPVTSMVAALLCGQVSLDQAKELLLSRPLRHELG